MTTVSLTNIRKCRGCDFYVVLNDHHIVEGVPYWTCSKGDHPDWCSERRQQTCPSCGSSWTELRQALDSPQEWVNYPGLAYGGFMGKSQAQVNAETVISRCSLCLEHFGWIKKKGGEQ